MGSFAGVAYYSAIDTYINNYPIRAYNANDRQLICTEDLRNYGFSVGVVTMEDILEELVGEIWDERDDVVEDIQKISDGEYIVSGSADAEDVFALFDLQYEVEQNTVNGWVMDKLEKIPEVGDTFTENGLKVTVRKMDGRVIDKVHIKKEEAEQEE